LYGLALNTRPTATGTPVDAAAVSAMRFPLGARGTRS
jgi:hypothetical protein